MEASLSPGQVGSCCVCLSARGTRPTAPSASQVCFFLAYGWSLSLWIIAEWLNRSRCSKLKSRNLESDLGGLNPDRHRACRKPAHDHYDAVGCEDTEAGKTKEVQLAETGGGSSVVVDAMSPPRQAAPKTTTLSFADAWGSGLIR